MKLDFMAESVAGLAPEALEAVIAANDAIDIPYGGDRWSRRAAELIRAKLDADAEVRFLASGTAANALALSLVAEPFETVLAHERAHILCEEMGAPGFYGGGLGITGLAGADGVVTPDAVGLALAGQMPRERRMAALSIANLTEAGTVYETSAFEALVGLAKQSGLLVHLDGARLAAAEAAGFDPRAIARAGVDVAVLGGAKAGAGSVEAIAILNPALARTIDARLKQVGQQVAKSRLDTAGLVGLMETGGWEKHARHAARQARRIADRVVALGWPIVHPVHANMIFVAIPEPGWQLLSRKGWIFSRSRDGIVRIVTHWASTDARVDGLIDDLERAAQA